MAPQRKIPDGWFKIDRVNPRNGKHEMFYTNVLGQKFFSMEGLLHYVSFARKRRLSIYSEDFDALAFGKCSQFKARNANSSERKVDSKKVPDTSHASQAAPEPKSSPNLSNIQTRSMTAKININNMYRKQVLDTSHASQAAPAPKSSLNLSNIKTRSMAAKIKKEKSL